ncbi:hypothetical protein ACLMJK_008159 [Lecanora helva]
MSRESPTSQSTPLPLIDLSPLSSPNPTSHTVASLSTALSTAFSTTGFAYLTHVPLNCTDTEVFSLARKFFSLNDEQKMSVARNIFRKVNGNTYRGYFPAQKGEDNLKEGFEMGSADRKRKGNQVRDTKKGAGFDLEEENVWPTGFSAERTKLEKLHAELQALSGRLLSLLAMALEKEEGYFDEYMTDSLSTLRLLHYPAPNTKQQDLCCTPHTDSGILTLLHQDATGGLEVLSSDEKSWIPAPYIPNSIVVNVGDLMSRISGGRFKATMHRVRSSPGRERFSVPFFFEPGRECVIRSVGEEGDGGVVYGRHVLEKMRGWVEFGDEGGEEVREEMERGREVLVEA